LIVFFFLFFLFFHIAKCATFCYTLPMMIFCVPYAPIPDRAALLALMPPLRRIRYMGESPGPLFAYALLAWALEKHCSLVAKEALAYSAEGRPHVPNGALHLSLSHSKTHALLALSSAPLGCDIETHRTISERARRRVLGAGRSTEDFFAHWTLRESYFKLTGHFGWTSPLPFTLTGDKACGEDAHGWLYREIPGCTAAVVAREPFPRPALTLLDPKTIFDYAAEKLT
jgi:hypothetical protein